MKQTSLRNQGLLPLAALLGWLVLLPRTGQAQLYYALDNGAATTTLDQLRRSPLAAAETALTTATTNTVAAPGAIAVDQAGNSVFIADVRNNALKIVAVSLTSPYTVSTFLTPAAIAGASASTLGGLVVDKVNCSSTTW